MPDMNPIDSGRGLLRESVMLQDDDATLLSYEILSDPNPLRASDPKAPAKATLTLAVSNSKRVKVDCASITVTLAVGTNAKDLVASADGITSQMPAGWSATPSGGTFTLQPKTSTDGQIGEDGLSFVFAGLEVNGEVGMTEVTIDEEAWTDAQPAQERTVSIPLPKFPTQFTLNDLTAEPLEVSAGDAATLNWSGSPDPATYVLEFDSGSGGQSVPVGNQGPYTANSLTRYPEVIFTLVVSYPVPGEDQPLVAQKQASVQVNLLPPVVTSFTGSTHDGHASFDWASQNADTCSMNALPQLLKPSGHAGPLAVDRIRYTLVAISSRTDTSSAPSNVDLHASVTRQQPIQQGRGQPETWLAATPDGSLVAVVNDRYMGGTYVCLIDQASLEVTGSARYDSVGSALALSPDGTRLFATTQHDDESWWLTLLTIPSLAPLEVPSWFGAPAGAAFSPDGATLYLPDYYKGTAVVHVLDASSLAERRSFPVPDVGTCAVSADGARLYIVGEDSLIVADTATGTILGQPPIGDSAVRGGGVVDARRNRAFVSNTNVGTVSVVDLATMTTLSPVPVGDGPLGIVMGPSGDEVYVASTGPRCITVIDADALTVITTLPVPGQPAGVAFAPGPALKLYTLATDFLTAPVLCLIEVTS